MSKKILAMLLVVAMVCTLFVTPVLADEAGLVAINDDSAAAFPDTVGNWAESSINRWSAANVVNGDHAGNFNPSNTITRAELAQVLVNLLGLTDKAEAGTFTDVNAGDWFEDAVLKCAAAGIMQGDGTGLANPNSPITRQEAIVMIGRALGVQPVANPTMTSFQDGETVADWAAPYLAPLTAMGILTGVADADGNVNVLPQLNIDRASTMALLDKAIAQYVVNGGTVKADDADKFVVVKAPEGEEVVITGETAGVTVAAGNAADVKLDKVTADSVKVDAAVKVTVDQGSTVDNLALNAPAKIQNSGTVNTVANNVADATFDGKAPGKIENAEGVPALKDSNGNEVKKGGIIVIGGGAGGGSSTPPAVQRAEIVFITEENYETLAPTYNYYGATEETLRPAADVQLPWLLVKYERNEAGTVEVSVTKDGEAVQFGTVAEGETDPTLTDSLTFEAAAANKSAWVSFHMVSQAETDHKGQTWLNQANANGEYVATVKMNNATTASPAKTYPETAEPSGEPTLWLVGDSTVCNFLDEYYYPRYGYGTQIENYLDGTYKVQNLAISGTSSKSFVTHKLEVEASDGTKTEVCNYDILFDATNGIKEGDALIIGFGHNDEKTDERFTDPTGDWQTAGSFAESLWTNYVSKAQAKGAEVILCTPIVRRATKTVSETDKTTVFSDSNLHIANGGSYPDAIKALGTAKNVPVVDLTTLTKDLYNELTPTGTMKLHARMTSKENTVDNTHLNVYGAKLVAYTLAEALQAGDTELGKHVDLSAGKPTEADLPDRSDWVDPPYKAPAPDVETMWKEYVAKDESNKSVTFTGSAFGNLGGAPTTENFALETNTDGSARVAGLNTGKGKIQSSDDGVAMYYYRVPVGSKVEFAAKMKVVKLNANNQSGFGLMARDDMYIDINQSGINSNYVAAGTFGNSKANCWYRKDAALGGFTVANAETGAAAENNLPSGVLAEGKTYQLVLKSTDTGFTCTFDDQETRNFENIALNGVDQDYYYIGMFSTRGTEVAFSDIYLKVNDEVLLGTAPAEEPAASETTFAAMDADLYGTITWAGVPALTNMQENVTFTPDATTATTIKVGGTLKYVTGFTGFNESKADEQEGNYVALMFTVPAEALTAGKVTLVKGHEGTTNKVFDLSAAGAVDEVSGQKVFGTLQRISGTDAVVKYTIDWDGDGDAYAATTYTLDFSGATLEPSGDQP